MFKERFGIEIEMTGISRNKASEVISTYFNSRVISVGDYYDTKTIKDNQGRTWKVMYAVLLNACLILLQ